MPKNPEVKDQPETFDVDVKLVGNHERSDIKYFQESVHRLHTSKTSSVGSSEVVQLKLNWKRI